MSAFMVSDDVIDLIVTFAVAKKVYFWDETTNRAIEGSHETATEIGRVLIAENERSVCHRYSQTIENLAAAYVWRPFQTAEPVPLVAVLAAVHCLDYQSCETDDWKRTRAYYMLADIKDAAARAMAGFDDVRLGFLHELRTDKPAAPDAPQSPARAGLRVVK